MTEGWKKRIKNWLRSNKELVEAIHTLASIAAIVSIVIAIFALWCSVNTFKTELKMDRCNKLNAEKIKINGLIQEIDYNLELAIELNNEIPDLINDRRRTKHLVFVTENMKANMDGSIKDTKFNVQLIKTYNRIVQLNSRLSFIDSPTIYLNSLVYSDRSYNRSFAWDNTKKELIEDINELQILRADTMNYNSTIETC